MRKRRFAPLFAAASTTLGIVAPALGVTTTWLNTTGNGLWVDPANWSNGVPTAADTDYPGDGNHHAAIEPTGGR